MPAGLGGGGSVYLAFETVMGTYIEPNAAGVIACPILEENLLYTEDKYYSPQIRKQTIVSDVKQSYYHVEGDITVEVDPTSFVYFLYASRHIMVKAGAGPYTYTVTPGQQGSASTAAGTSAMKTLSITIFRNNIGFGYFGCVVGGYEFTIEDGVLKCTLNILGMGEQTPGTSPSAAYVAPNLYGADAHQVFVATAAVSPTFGAASVDFNGFTFNANFNAEAQNRIVTNRAASYISYGETEATYDTELDFVDKTEYDNMKAATTRAVRLLSKHGGTDVATSTDALQITVNRSAYDAYEVPLGAMGDLIMASTTGKVIGIAGGDPYNIVLKSAVSIT